MPTRRPVLALASVLALALAVTGCTGAEPRTDATPSPSASSPTRTPDPTELTLGVYGIEDEMVAWNAVVTGFNAMSTTGEVRLVEWNNHDAAIRSLRAGEVPDVFMVSRQDLDYLLEEDLTRPVSELLDERGVDFGDDFSRDAVQSFAVDDQLQCMAYSISPMVIYLNSDLIDFDRMENRGLDVPDRWDRWSLEEFTAAAEFASRPARGTRGFHIEPSIEGLSPFIHSGGGSVFNDDESPTSLNFSDDDTRAALEEALAVLRDPSLTLTDGQLAKRSALEWFKRGKLGMIAGYRDLVPELRQVQDLSFNVMPMPRLDSSTTVGEITGLCMSSQAADQFAAADLIAYLVGDAPVERVTRAGAMVPANLSVAGSDAFLQVGRQPARSRVFNTAIRGMVLPPLLDSWEPLEEAVDRYLEQLLTAPGELDLETLTEQIDEASTAVLDPDVVDESPESTPEPSGTE